MKKDLYKILKKVNEKYRFLTPKDNFLNIGCGEGGALKYASEVINEGIIVGIELDESFKDGLVQLSEEKDKIKVIYENPLREETWKKAKFRVKSILNSLNLDPVKSLQAVENSLKVLVPDGRIVSIYTHRNKKLIENFLTGLPLTNNEFFEVEGNLLSISEKKKGIIDQP